LKNKVVFIGFLEETISIGWIRKRRWRSH